MTILIDRRAGELFLSQWRHPNVSTRLASPEFEHNPAAQRTLEHLADDFGPLREAHIFLRRLINVLRMVRGHAKDLTVSPPGSEEFAVLARRLDYGQQAAQLRDDLSRHTTCVQQLSARLLG
ncbi:MAG: hypothetical protein HC875_24330 [Anaerolineales bacterium]|nr:hypothetical protein [Anaerolineales bacterium]